MEQQDNQEPQGEFHHFQMVDSEGRIPFSISVLVHYNYQEDRATSDFNPITSDEVVNFHYALKEFDGNFERAFKHS